MCINDITTPYLFRTSVHIKHIILFSYCICKTVILWIFEYFRSFSIILGHFEHFCALLRIFVYFYAFLSIFKKILYFRPILTLLVVAIYRRKTTLIWTYPQTVLKCILNLLIHYSDALKGVPASLEDLTWICQERSAIFKIQKKVDNS